MPVVNWNVFRDTLERAYRVAIAKSNDKGMHGEMPALYFGDGYQ